MPRDYVKDAMRAKLHIRNTVKNYVHAKGDIIKGIVRRGSRMLVNIVKEIENEYELTTENITGRIEKD